MRFDIISIMPDAFDSYFNAGILARSQARDIVDINIHNLRDVTNDPHKTVDGRPYGGGAGMVLMAEPILKTVRNIQKKSRRKRSKIVLFSAKGKQFAQKMALDWSKKYDQIIFISGRYEGIDERVKVVLKAEELSIGPYVLTDGDVAAMTVISAITRLLPGAIKFESLKEESHHQSLSRKQEKSAHILEYPHYTRPEVIHWQGKKYKVPKVLLSGNHAQIAKWREAHSR